MDTYVNCDRPSADDASNAAVYNMCGHVEGISLDQEVGTLAVDGVVLVVERLVMRVTRYPTVSCTVDHG